MSKKSFKQLLNLSYLNHSLVKAAGIIVDLVESRQKIMVVLSSHIEYNAHLSTVT